MKRPTLFTNLSTASTMFLGFRDFLLDVEDMLSSSEMIIQDISNKKHMSFRQIV